MMSPGKGRILLSARLHEYLLEIVDGPKTTGDLVLSQMVSANSCSKAMKKLRGLGLVRSEQVPGRRGRTFRHSVVGDYEVWKERIKIEFTSCPSPISEGEVLYAALLKNGGLTGWELVAQYQVVFPHKSRAAIDHIKSMASRRRLCR